LSLLLKRLYDGGVTVSLIHRGVAAQEIKILFAVHIPHMNAFAPAEDYRQGMIVVGTVFLFEINKILLHQ
jgi:hypothetical protein